MSAVAPIPGWGIARGHTLSECASAEGCGMTHDPEPVVYTHPDDIDLVEVDWDLDPMPEVAQSLGAEIRWLRDQRSQLAHALVRADARADLADFGLTVTDTTGRR